jgi:hypothetical protein
MEPSASLEADSGSTGQEIFRISWNPKVHYHAHKSPPPVSVRSRTNPIHTLQHYFLKICFNYILHQRLGFPSGFFPSESPTKFCTRFSSNLCVLHAHPISISFPLLLGHTMPFRATRVLFLHCPYKAVSSGKCIIMLIYLRRIWTNTIFFFK